MSTFQVACPSCGCKLVKLVELEDKRSCARCTQCGLNTGPKKNHTRAINAWNAMKQRATPNTWMV